MPIALEELKQKLTVAFSDSTITINDIVGDQNHYQVKIVSNKFLGLGRIHRHKLVNKALNDCLGGELHALSITTITHEEAKNEHN